MADPWTYLRGSPDAALVLDGAGTVCFANELAVLLFGRELVGEPASALFPQAQRATIQEELTGYLEAPSCRPLARDGARVLQADGSEVPVDASLIPISTDGGLRVVLTLRERFEELQNLGHLTPLFDVAPDALLAVDEGGTIVLANGLAEELLAGRATSLVGRPVADFVPTALQGRHEEHVARYLASPRQRRMGGGAELIARRADGSQIPIEVSLAPVTLREGRVVVAALRDVTEQRALTEGLREADRRLHSALLSARMGLWELEVGTDVRRYSDGLLALLGRQRAHESGDAFFDAVHPEDRGRVGEATARALQRWEPYHLELRVAHADGSWRWFETHAEPHRGPNGVVLLGVALDVTAEHVAREQLLDARTQLEAVLASAPDFVQLIDRGGFIQFINRAGPGVPREAVIGRHWSDFVAPEAHDAVRAPLERVLAGGGAEVVEVPSIEPGIWYANHIGPVLRAGEVVGVAVISHDISRRRALEAELAAAGQLAALGTVAASLAHELNNPLGALLTNLEILGAREVETRERSSDELEDALDAARRLRAIVGELQLFGRTEVRAAAPVDLRSIVRSTRRLLRNEIRHRAVFRMELEPAPYVVARDNELAQVVMNLLTNAAQAIPEGVRDRNEIVVRTRPGPGGTAELQISDTGKGISPENLPRIFEAFYTTRVGEGTGRGLAIAKGIVEGLGGVIEVESRVGVGTTFTVRLPGAAPTRKSPEIRRRTPRPTTPPVAPAPASTRPRVLIVDDDPSMLRVAKRVLQSSVELTAFADGEEALRALAEGPLPDVVLCDLMMPNLSGTELFRSAVARWPALRSRFLFVSGGAFTDEARAFLAAETVRMLQKPYTPAELRAAVEELARASRG